MNGHRFSWVTRKTGNYLLTGKRRKLPENAGKHLKYIKIWVAEVEGCNLDVYMGFMEVMNNIGVPICRKKIGKIHHRVAVVDALMRRHSQGFTGRNILRLIRIDH